MSECDWLIAKARRAQNAVYLATEKSVADDLARIIVGLVDALESATRELDDLEERLAGYLCDSTGGLLSKTGYDVRTMVAHTEDYYDKVHAEARKEVEAERDAALAAVDRVKAELEALWIARGEPKGPDAWYSGIVQARAKVLAALDGAPEPDREKQLERVAARLREIVYLCGDDLGCQCEEAQGASANLARELSIIAAERPTLTADEVWAIAKAEHDFAGDRDNVGAFVDSLTDALRTAGVAFDEQPFIGSGYLLPVEGESK